MHTYFKVKDGMLEPWKAWCDLLMTTLNESAIATLREENLVMERMVLLEGGYIRGESEGEGKSASMTLPINKLHKFMKRQCLERAEPIAAVEAVEIEVLYELR